MWYLYTGYNDSLSLKKWGQSLKVRNLPYPSLRGQPLKCVVRVITNSQIPSAIFNFQRFNAPPGTRGLFFALSPLCNCCTIWLAIHACPDVAKFNPCLLIFVLNLLSFKFELKIWERVVQHFVQIEEPSFKVTVRAVLDRYTFLAKNFRKRMASEQKASGICPEMNELDVL